LVVASGIKSYIVPYTPMEFEYASNYGDVLDAYRSHVNDMSIIMNIGSTNTNYRGVLDDVIDGKILFLAGKIYNKSWDVENGMNIVNLSNKPYTNRDYSIELVKGRQNFMKYILR